MDCTDRSYRIDNVDKEYLYENWRYVIICKKSKSEFSVQVRAV